MNIVDLIQHLQEMVLHGGDDQVVRSWCPEGEEYFPVTGFVYGGAEGFVDLYTDSDECEDDD